MCFQIVPSVIRVEPDDFLLCRAIPISIPPIVTHQASHVFDLNKDIFFIFELINSDNLYYNATYLQESI